MISSSFYPLCIFFLHPLVNQSCGEHSIFFILLYLVCPIRILVVNTHPSSILKQLQYKNDASKYCAINSVMTLFSHKASNIQTVWICWFSRGIFHCRDRNGATKLCITEASTCLLQERMAVIARRQKKNQQKNVFTRSC